MIKIEHIISLMNSSIAVGGWFLFANAFFGFGGWYLILSFGWYAVWGGVFFAYLYLHLVYHYNTKLWENGQEILNRTPKGIAMLNDATFDHWKYDLENSYSWLVFHIQYWGLVAGVIAIASFIRWVIIG